MNENEWGKVGGGRNEKARIKSPLTLTLAKELGWMEGREEKVKMEIEMREGRRRKRKVVQDRWWWRTEAKKEEKKLKL